MSASEKLREIEDKINKWENEIRKWEDEDVYLGDRVYQDMLEERDSLLDFMSKAMTDSALDKI